MKLTSLVLLLLVNLTSGEADGTIIVPEDSFVLEGDSAQSAPFDWVLGSSFRYQQVFAESQFNLIRPAGGLVYAMFFRVDSPLGQPFAATFTNLQINLSTTPRAPDSLSPVFTENVGPDDRIVFGPGRMGLRSLYSPGSAPQAFEVEVRFATPFFYNPDAGNLLLDMRVFQSAMTSPMDGWAQVGDPVSSVLAYSVGASSGMPSTFGFASSIQVTPVPEPGVMTLAVLAGLLTTLHCVKRRHKERRQSVAA